MALFAIQNNTGGSLSYQGTTISSGSYVYFNEIKKSGYQVQRAKLWASDTGRSMTGVYKGTLTGIFPKITATINTGRLSADDIQTITKLVDQDFASCKYYDQRSNSTKTADFYFDDFTTTIKKTKGGKQYESLTITAVAVKKYS